MNTLKESSTSIQNCRRCHITKWIVQLLNAEFDIKDEDRRWREICWMVLNTDCERETVGSACACKHSSNPGRNLKGQWLRRRVLDAFATFPNARLRCCYCAVESPCWMTSQKVHFDGHSCMMWPISNLSSFQACIDVLRGTVCCVFPEASNTPKYIWHIYRALILLTRLRISGLCWSKSFFTAMIKERLGLRIYALKKVSECFQERDNLNHLSHTFSCLEVLSSCSCSWSCSF